MNADDLDAPFNAPAHACTRRAVRTSFTPLQPARLAYTPDGRQGPRRSTISITPPTAARARRSTVFLHGNGLPENWAGRQRLVILENGFGSGLNFLATGRPCPSQTSANPALHRHRNASLRGCRSGETASCMAATGVSSAEARDAHALAAIVAGVPPTGVRRRPSGSDPAAWRCGNQPAPIARQRRSDLDGFAPQKEPADVVCIAAQALRTTRRCECHVCHLVRRQTSGRLWEQPALPWKSVPATPTSGRCWRAGSLSAAFRKPANQRQPPSTQQSSGPASPVACC